jgi:transcriptional regulator of PTS gene
MVFSVIRQKAPLPRIDIVTSTGLSPASITSITAHLIAKGLIQEVASTTRTTGLKRGRPTVDLKVRGAAHMVAGIKLTDQSATVTIVDFDGKQITGSKFASPASILTKAQVLDFLEQVLTDTLDQCDLNLADLSGVGIGIPGLVDALKGHVYWSPILTDRDLPLQSMLYDRFGVPVFLDNDANLVAIAEQRFGHGKTARNFIVISVEQGVGMGIVVDGKLYRGANGCGAELAHTKVHLDGALCRCGQRGCLEAYVGDYALLREASTALDFEPGSSTQQQMEALIRHAGAENQLAKSIIERAGRMFAMGLANMVNIFAPELIILSGVSLQYDYLYDADMIEEMKMSIVQMGGPPPAVVIHKWGDEMWAMGAAAYAIDGVGEIALREG